MPKRRIGVPPEDFGMVMTIDRPWLPVRLAGALIMMAMVWAAAAPAGAEPLTVEVQEITDLKAVFGTVESVDTVDARARISGTLTGLAIDEGSLVTEGEAIAVVEDDKLPLQLAALDAQLEALRAQRSQAETELERARRLRASGAGSQARLDDAQTALNVVTAELAAMEAQREVVQQQVREGDVLAPATGRVLAVPVINGTVVMSGEPVATVASDTYVLRLYLPERHARFIEEGDSVLVGAAGLSSGTDDLREGTIRQVYPRMDQGRVVADVTVSGLGDFFVGERTRVYVGTGRRPTIVIPQSHVYQRFGVDYVRLADGREVAVRTGQPVPEGALAAGPAEGIEILSGLEPGDVIVPPDSAAGEQGS